MGLDIYFTKMKTSNVGYFRKVNFLVRYFADLGFDVENQVPFGITKDDVYTIDSCGRGEVLVISSTGKDSASKELANRFKVLYENTIQLAKKTCKESWITIPVPYGDNAGFMALGIPAVAITLLPKDEATSYMRELQKHNKIYQNILNLTTIKLDLKKQMK